MDYTSDSDVSENTRELIDQGLASLKRKRLNTASQTRRTSERISVPNMDITSVRHPLRLERSTGATSTHGFNIAGREMAIGQKHNIGTAEVGFEVVAEPRSTRAELSRRAGGCKLSSEEMLIAYGELESEMNELRNNMGRRTNISDIEALNAWRKRVETSRAEAYGDIESRAEILADAASRVRERQYGGARVIDVVPM